MLQMLDLRFFVAEKASGELRGLLICCCVFAVSSLAIFDTGAVDPNSIEEDRSKVIGGFFIMQEMGGFDRNSNKIPKDKNVPSIRLNYKFQGVGNDYITIRNHAFGSLKIRL